MQLHTTANPAVVPNNRLATTPRHGGVLPFWRLFIAVDTAAPPPSRGDIVGRPEFVFRPAARRNRHWFLTVSAFVRQRTISCFRASSALTHIFCYFCPPAFSHATAPTTGVSLRSGMSTDGVLFSFSPQASQSGHWHARSHIFLTQLFSST